MSNEGQDFEYGGRQYLIRPIDAMVGSRIAMLNLKGLSNLSETDFSWVQAKALSAVSRYEDKNGVNLPVPIFAAGQGVIPDLRQDATTLTVLMQQSINVNVTDDFFASNAIEMLLPKAMREKLAEAKKSSS